MLGLYPLAAAPLSAPQLYLVPTIPPPDPVPDGTIDAEQVPRYRWITFDGSIRVVRFD